MFVYNISLELVVSLCSQQQVRNDDPVVWWHANCNSDTSTIRKVGSISMISGESLQKKWSAG